MKLTQEKLKENLKYEPDTGHLYWVESGAGRKAGALAGNVNSGGYRQIGVKGKRYGAHRLAWLYVHGYLPEHEVHHINHITDDNRIDNLSEESGYCNKQEKNTNTSGKSGVHFDKTHNMWKVQHWSFEEKKRRHHGYYKSFEEACKVKDAAIEADKQPKCDLSGIQTWKKKLK